MVTNETYIFSNKAKKNLAIIFIVGVVLTILGIALMLYNGEHEITESKGHGVFNWTTRLYANLWINNMYFLGLAIIGVFFVAIQYATQAGWSAGLKRIPMAFGNWLPISFILILGVFLLAGNDLFHWTHHGLYDETSPDYDSIIAGKKGYLNMPFFIGRMVVYFVVWYLLFHAIKKRMYAEDIEGGEKNWKKNLGLSAAFLVFFGYSSSMAAWDWIMSIDTHWFSTMFGWYVFASWWVSGLALITFVVVLLKDKGYLSIVNENHLHDLGKLVFGFSIFWTYIWFSQFLLIYYANIPEETIYFVERLASDQYSPFFFLNLIMNFCFPFLLLMTRQSKRHSRILKIVMPIVLLGHWIDFYLMITPGTLKSNGGFGLLEIGILMIYLVVFLYVILNSLSKHPLVAKNHPMLEESLHHHI